MIILATTLIVGGVMIAALWSWLRQEKKKADLGKGVSIIIPFRYSPKAPERKRNLEWLLHYWEAQLPEAEILLGDDPDTNRPFSKSVAINRAAQKATGDIYVLVDADGYFSAKSVVHCAREIRKARKKNLKLWFVPYRQFYRLNEEASLRVLKSDPRNPYLFPEVPDEKDILNDTNAHTGHWYGAMIQIVPREAFELVGGWDQEFIGWGGEDHAAMRAMDTLYWPHKTLPGNILHIWHPMIGSSGVERMVNWRDRRWEGQNDPAHNAQRGNRYHHAFGKPALMRKLVDEWKTKPASASLDRGTSPRFTPLSS